jgi:hypothetical protein
MAVKYFFLMLIVLLGCVRIGLADGGQGATFTRAEERGESFEGRQNKELVEVLKKKDVADKVDRHKAAKEIGDRARAYGGDHFSKEEKEAIKEEVKRLLLLARSKNADERVEAREQIERLWLAALPALLDGLDDENLSVVELAIKSLILMRNEEVVSELLEKGRGADESTKKTILFTLKKMKEQRVSSVPDRNCLDEESSEELFDTFVAPAIKELATL